MECVTIQDATGRTTARICVGFGFNCFQFQVPHRGRTVDVLWSEPEFEAGQRRASGSGIPILFPFPGRIPGTVFRFEGREYILEEGDGRGNAIHGFVLNRPWRVIEHSSSTVVGQFQASLDDPTLLDRWPADFRITVTYQIAPSRLTSDILVENPADSQLPCGLGTHPYFRVPLGGPIADDCLVQLPARQRWELKEMLPTGNKQPVADAEGLQRGLKFGAIRFDDVFTDLHFEGSSCRPKIVDPAGASLTLAFDHSFPNCVVYTPPHREAICIEPYSCLPGGFELGQAGIDTGWKILDPAESYTARVELRVESEGEGAKKAGPGRTGGR